MALRAYTNPEAGNRARIAEHVFVTPVVRATPTPTAHPLAQAWPTRFERLQRRLLDAEAAVCAGTPRSVVVLPSRTLEKFHEPPALTQALEERLLCSLLELADPNLRLTYVTSAPVAPAIVDYYLSLLPRRVRRSALSRLTLVALGDRSPRPVSEKLLERPQVIARIRRAISDPRHSHVAPYSVTPLDCEVALALDLPIYGADPRHAQLGTKSGSRALFQRAGVPHPAGIEQITTVRDAIAAIATLRATNPDIRELIVKLEHGVCGDGNAIIDVRDLPAPRTAGEPAAIAARLTRLVPEAPAVTATQYLAQLERQGAIVEQRITATELRSPSVQLQITPAGEVQLLSTHDQILGGRDGQTYHGCSFPAERSYAPAISTLARRLGEHLATEGVIGRFAFDFVVARNTHGWQPFAIELNLRKGGTTHPFQTLAALTAGTYNPDDATYTTRTGQTKHYIATDHLQAPQLRTTGRARVLALATRHDLGFDRIRATGTIVHMLSSLDELGRVGLTAIGDTAEQAKELYERSRVVLLHEAADTTPTPHPTTAVPRLAAA
jgi:hypothetical protein